MIDVLKGTLSKPYIKQSSCLLCVAPNDKLGYCRWKLLASGSLLTITWAGCLLPCSV